jgi:hypothetical protein
MTIEALKPVRVGQSGLGVPFICAARTAYGAYVVRSAAGTVKGAPLEDTEDGIGFVESDNDEHTYDGFYEQYEPVSVITAGLVNALVAAIADTNIVAGDYLEVIDVSSGTQANPCGVLGEAGSDAGETKTTTSVAQAMEDVTLGSASYSQSFTTNSVGDTSITVTSGVPTTMGLVVGQFILLRDANGNCQLNRVTSLTATTIGLEIPASLALTGSTDYIHAVKQILVKIL